MADASKGLRCLSGECAESALENADLRPRADFLLHPGIVMQVRGRDDSGAFPIAIREARRPAITGRVHVSIGEANEISAGIFGELWMVAPDLPGQKFGYVLRGKESRQLRKGPSADESNAIG
jgi:hypothetical protein